MRVRWFCALLRRHYAHWFQPLTGAPAYKSQAFFKRRCGYICVLCNGCTVSSGCSRGRPLRFLFCRKAEVLPFFSGKLLAVSETDGSSFPNGGLRETHTARAYASECMP